MTAANATAQLTNWPEFRFGNDRLGYNPYESLLRPSNVNNLGVLWQVNPSQQLIMVSPAVVNGVVYGIAFGEGRQVTTLFALNATTGATIWLRPMLGQFFLSAPTVVNGVVYLGLGLYNPYYTGAVYAFDARTGAVLWSNATVNAIQTAPTVSGGAVYFASDSDVVYSLDATNGHVLWRYDTGMGGQGASAAGALANGVFYIGVAHFIYAFDANNGTPLWRFQMTDSAAASPAVKDGVVYGASYDGNVYALNASTGAVVWTRSTDQLYFTSPSIAYGKVYVCGFDGNLGLAALDQQTGNVLWNDPTTQCEFASPSVANGIVYAAWEPVGTQSGHVQAFAATTGALLWDFPVNSALYTSPVVVNGRLYIGTYNGYMMAFGLNAP